MGKIIIARRDSLQSIEIEDLELPIQVENDGGLICIYDLADDAATRRLRAAVPMPLVTAITTNYDAF